MVELVFRCPSTGNGVPSGIVTDSFSINWWRTRR